MLGAGGLLTSEYLGKLEGDDWLNNYQQQRSVTKKIDNNVKMLMSVSAVRYGVIQREMRHFLVTQCPRSMFAKLLCLVSVSLPQSLSPDPHSVS